MLSQDVDPYVKRKKEAFRVELRKTKLEKLFNKKRFLGRSFTPLFLQEEEK